MEDISNKLKAPMLNTPIEFTNSEEYTIDNESKLTISYNDRIVSFEVNKSSLPPKDFKAILSLEQLYKLDKLFINFENSKELVNWVTNSLKQKNSSIKFLDNKCIIQMKNPISNKTFELNLTQKEKDLNSRVDCLEAIIAEQNKKINTLEERIKKLEDIINKYEEEKKEKEKEKEKKEKLNSLFKGTQILNDESKKMLISWLPRKPIKLTLLMNSNIDGDSTTAFMKKVNGKCPTLAVIKTTNGYIFGGYTTQLWKEGEVKDENAFVFSIDKKKKYLIKQPEHATGYRNNSWWLFGYSYNAIICQENCTKKNDNYVDNGTYDIPEKYELNGGERNFTVKSFEIYQVEY